MYAAEAFAKARTEVALMERAPRRQPASPWTQVSIPDAMARANYPRLQTSSERTKARELYGTLRAHVYTCTSYIAKRIAGQPVRLAVASSSPDAAGKRGRLSGVKAVSRLYLKAGASLIDQQDLTFIDDHPLLDLMDKPNPLQSLWEFGFVSSLSYYLTGVCYWVMAAGDGGEPEMWSIPTSWIEPDHKEGLFANYKLKVGEFEEGYRLPGEAVVRTYHPDPSDLQAVLPPVWAQLLSVRTDHHIQASQKVAFEHGIYPNIAIKMGRIGGKSDAPRRKITEAQRRDLITLIKKMYGGIMGYGEPAILDAMIDEIIPITRANREMDWLNSGEMVKKRISQGIHLNPYSIGEVTGSNRAQAVVAMEQEAQAALNPMAEQFSASLTARVAPTLTGRDDLLLYYEPFVGHDDELTTKRWEIGVKHNLVTEDEYRQRMLGLPAREEVRDQGGRNSMLGNPQALTAAIKLLELVGNGVVPAGTGNQLLKLFFDIEPAEIPLEDGEKPEPPVPFGQPQLPLKPPEEEQPPAEAAEFGGLLQRLLRLGKNVKGGKLSRDELRRHFGEVTADNERALEVASRKFFRGADEGDPARDGGVGGTADQADAEGLREEVG